MVTDRTPSVIDLGTFRLDRLASEAGSERGAECFVTTAGLLATRSAIGGGAIIHRIRHDTVFFKENCFFGRYRDDFRNLCIDIVRAVIPFIIEADSHAIFGSAFPCRPVAMCSPKVVLGENVPVGPGVTANLPESPVRSPWLQFP